MAADPGTSERVYQEIRRRLLAGEFHARERLDVSRLATSTRASATPVREALARLAVERLISARPSQGYFASVWTEGELRALYQWRLDLILLAVSQQGGVESANSNGAEYARRVAHLFQGIEKRANTEVRRAAVNADDRLWAARRVEPEIFSDTGRELLAIETAMGGPQPALMRRLRAYHARRLAAASSIRDRALLSAQPPNGK